MKKPYKILYHVFTDNFDDWTETYKEALNIIKNLKADGYENLRIYKELYETKKNYEDSPMVCDEECIYSKGAWPM